MAYRKDCFIVDDSHIVTRSCRTSRPAFLVIKRFFQSTNDALMDHFGKIADPLSLCLQIYFKVNFNYGGALYNNVKTHRITWQHYRVYYGLELLLLMNGNNNELFVVLVSRSIAGFQTPANHSTEGNWSCLDLNTENRLKN